MDRQAARTARLDALATTHAPRIRAALIRQAETAVARLLQLDALTPLVPELLAALIKPDMLVVPLTRLYVACGTAEAADTYRWLTEGLKAAAPPGVKESWAGRLRLFITTEGAQAIQGITDSTRRIVRRALNESLQAGEGVAEAARRLRNAVATLARPRAQAIARTELNAASNFGSLIGAESTGLALERVWIATKDGRTRPDHVAADGQRQPLQGGVFNVGGYMARYPGDPLLPASERANCRCAVGYARK